MLFHVKRGPDPTDTPLDPAAVSRLGSQARALGVRLSAETASQLLRLEALLRERAIPAGMVAEGDLHRVRDRHVLDCLRAATVLASTDRAALDLGTGAGLPGLVVAIALPRLAVTLVDRRPRRAAFCELAAERLGLGNVRVLVARIEDLTEEVDVCFARALAPLPEAWRLAEPLLREGGRLVYFAGRGAIGPFEAPGARCLSTVETPVLEGSGPLVIMGRQ